MVEPTPSPRAAAALQRRHKRQARQQQQQPKQRGRRVALGRRSGLGLVAMVACLGAVAVVYNSQQEWALERQYLFGIHMKSLHNEAAAGGEHSVASGRDLKNRPQQQQQQGGGDDADTTRTSFAPFGQPSCDACQEPTAWKAQSGQDAYLWQRVLKPQNLCCKGVFVEFGARNGVEHSNTWTLEHSQAWTGLLFEVDAREFQALRRNRPASHVVHGPVCPSNLTNVTIGMSFNGGWTGSVKDYGKGRLVRLCEWRKSILRRATRYFPLMDSLTHLSPLTRRHDHRHSTEPTRRNTILHSRTYPCHYLAHELRQRNMHRIDYMTIDTEGSELDIVLDFPWQDFDVRIVQIEQLSPFKFKAQVGRREKIQQHLEGLGYKLLSNYAVARYDTDDLIFIRNVDEFVAQTSPHMQDGDYTAERQKLDAKPKVIPAAAEPASARNCECHEPARWTAQAGQDRYIWERVLKPQNLCCNGIFVEFGARNGVEHSNTWTFENYQGWKGLLMELDHREAGSLRRNRPQADVIEGAVCPRSEQNVTILISRNLGWTGSHSVYGK